MLCLVQHQEENTWKAFTEALSYLDTIYILSLPYLCPISTLSLPHHQIRQPENNLRERHAKNQYQQID